MRRNALFLVPIVLLALAVLYLRWSAGGGSAVPEHFPVLEPAELGSVEPHAGAPEEVATFGSGCFWCTEAVFAQLKGVTRVESGYSGGAVPNPSYEQVCSGRTGHAEVVQVTFDPNQVSYPELLEVFWRSHDPTTPDRQGNDRGPQYRSVVFTHSERQKRLAEQYKQKIDAAQVFRAPVVTEIVPFTAFYPAEAEHQNFFANNPRQGYCRAVIGPKVEKLRQVFRDRMKGG
ncbi:Peptide methionine sulfoxide reductase MsrA [Gemmata obscuriglobus]|uniref:Peptide methionine sulfoxide reductase MsrA n=1 Tax=Gemmata obscuriglobus TaxID=114 RepID=A0A2Z3GX13_9BACT|nr:peptide-methionine (S)-S-oxide reductase MsrA [Gemmata obscuriglobus]AWM36037.1 peptide-methionine (S)-S-oxide reductase [Gemmata obscuriglobus]QEG31388.1 Peptide methionine sulfoxide reductase MsrA [Gemmata obscuriglobus]VTS10728.1 peptide methionine sulfoxide reductase : Peptide methionine sulfoxide reductase MsrA OS=Rhodopirellula maiorica SM1 GN=msrA PE=3 SV=1: PMSR [Gemmata obscuriglobus UQM 2246]